MSEDGHILSDTHEKGKVICSYTRIWKTFICDLTFVCITRMSVCWVWTWLQTDTGGYMVQIWIILNYYYGSDITYYNIVKFFSCTINVVCLSAQKKKTDNAISRTKYKKFYWNRCVIIWWTLSVAVRYNINYHIEYSSSNSPTVSLLLNTHSHRSQSMKIICSLHENVCRCISKWYCNCIAANTMPINWFHFFSRF